MSKSREKIPEPESQVIFPEAVPDISTESGIERKLEIKQEIAKEREDEIKKLKQEIETSEEKDRLQTPVAETPEEKQERVKHYQEKYLPDYLRKKPGVVARFIRNFWQGSAKNIETQGIENVPEGACLVICNHFGGGDAEAISQTFKDKSLHFGIAKKIWWDSNPIMRWAFKKMGMIPVDESLSNISEAEKEAALLRQGSRGKKVFRQIIDNEKKGKFATNVDFIRQAVALLSRGETVGIFPEGLWLNPQGVGGLSREKKEMKQGYRGMELVAKKYKELTGEDLPIVPCAYIEDSGAKKKELKIGEPIVLDNNQSGLSGTDWALSCVAEMLPEEQRGYYRNLPQEQA